MTRLKEDELHSFEYSLTVEVLEVALTIELGVFGVAFDELGASIMSIRFRVGAGIEGALPESSELRILWWLGGSNSEGH